MSPESEAGPAEHLALGHPDPVAVFFGFFDDAGVPGQGESAVTASRSRSIPAAGVGRLGGSFWRTVSSHGESGSPLRSVNMWAKDRT